MTDHVGRRPSISVVVPIHNEAGYLPLSFPEMLAELAAVDADVDVILAENGSSDDTAAVAESLAAAHDHVRVIRLPDPDYGAAMRAGLVAGTGDWRVNFDVDYFSGAFLDRVATLTGEADIVIASKLAPGSRDERSPFRRFATRVFNLLLRVLFRSRVSDTHGMKAVSARVVDALVPSVRSTKDIFDTELVLRAERAGYRIVEVPTLVEERRVTDQGFLKRVPRTLLGLWKVRLALWRER